MNTKSNLYKFIGVMTSFIYFLAIIISIFSVSKFEFYDTMMKIILLLFTPAIYFLFYGITQIIDLLNTILNKLESNNIAINNDESDDDEETIEDEEQVEEDSDDDKTDNNEEKEEDNEDEENDEDEEEKYEPVIRDGKIQCRHCGKFNKMKRTYCYLCAKKLRD